MSINPLNLSTDFYGGWSGTETAPDSVSVSSAPIGGGIFVANLSNPVPVSNIGTKFLTLTGALTVPSTSTFFLTLTDSSVNQDTLTYAFTFSEFLSLGTGNPGIAFSGALTDPLDVSSFNGTVASYELDTDGLPTANVSMRFDNLAFTAVFVPEPSTYAMFGFGLFMLYFVYRRKAKAQTVRA